MKSTSKFHLIAELYNLTCGLDGHSFLLMNKLVPNRKSNAFVTINQKKKYSVLNHFVKDFRRNIQGITNLHKYYLIIFQIKNKVNWIF